MDKLRAVVHGTVLLLIIGWVLTAGKAIFVPAVLGAVVVYVIVGLAQVLGKVPAVGPQLPLQLRYLFSMAVIGLAFFLLAYLIMANKERAMALAPQYQQSLLASIQQIAVRFGFETEPTWNTLRQELLAQINLQRLFTGLPPRQAELDVVMETRGKAHVEQILATLENAGFPAQSL